MIINNSLEFKKMLMGWQTKEFKTRADMETFINRYGHKIQWNEILINQPTLKSNACCIEYRKLLVVY